MIKKLRKALPAAALALFVAVGVATPALASGLGFNTCLGPWQARTYVQSGYRNSSAGGALIKLKSNSPYGGNFWVELPGTGQVSQSVTVDADSGEWAQYNSTFSGNVKLYGHQVGWGSNSCDRVIGSVDFND